MRPARASACVDSAEAALEGAQVVLSRCRDPSTSGSWRRAVLRSAAAGTVVVDLSTIDPATARAAAATLAEAA